MRTDSVCTLFFSPTHTSKRVAEAIAEGVGAGKRTTLDVTCEMPKEIILNALTVIAAPVYEGHVAPLALQRFNHVQGQCTPAVLVVVYGNRAYDHALEELAEYAVSHGFLPVAAATFIGEHSYSSSAHPIAQGRPDKGDLELAREFGRKIKEKLQKVSDPNQLQCVDVKHMCKPAQPFFPLLRFIRRVAKIKKGAAPFARTPWMPDKDKCVHCGTCVKQCPTHAITAGNESYTETSLCIRCCACVKACPHQARVYETPFAEALSICFKKPKSPQTLL